MAIVLGIESTAHTYGIGIVKNGKILANVRDMYSTEKGGIIPTESAKHHEKIADGIYYKALAEAGINEGEVDAIAFSQGPGLSPCLLVGLRFAKNLYKRLNNLSTTAPTTTPEDINKKTRGLTKVSLVNNKSREKRGKRKEVPVVLVNHCIAHLEIGRITGAKDPVLLYASGANTQIIAYEAGKYRIFGETLDLGVGNFIDTFARYMGLGFPGGPKVEQLAKQSTNYIELPYTVKGMDIALSGILTNLKQKIEKIKKSENITYSRLPTQNLHSLKAHDIKDNVNPKKISVINSYKKSSEQSERANYSKEDLAFSMQETVFAMLVEVAERALAHVGKKELVLGGGVACNSRLQEMCKIMCEERGCKCFIPPKDLLTDNAAMIAYTGELMFDNGDFVKSKDVDKIDIKPRQRTDQVEVSWRS